MLKATCLRSDRMVDSRLLNINMFFRGFQLKNKAIQTTLAILTRARTKENVLIWVAVKWCVFATTASMANFVKKVSLAVAGLSRDVCGDVAMAAKSDIRLKLFSAVHAKEGVFYVSMLFYSMHLTIFPCAKHQLKNEEKEKVYRHV